MRKTLARIILGAFLLLSAQGALAGQAAPGAGLQGLSLLLAYDGSYLYYVERSSPNSRTIDKDYGWMNGGFAEARYDFQSAFVRLRGDMVGSNSATYDGALQNGTPYKTSTKESIYKAEFDAGYKIYDQDRLTLAPYVGLGYRDWKRGENALPMYKEDYSWWYGALGLNLNYRVDKWLLGFDFAVFCPFSMKMETDVAGLYDKAKFNIQPLPGVRVELPVGYELYSGEGAKLSVFFIPYYEKWEIGKSQTVAMTSGGVPTGDSFYEPKSTTDITGFRIGLGVSF